MNYEELYKNLSKRYYGMTPDALQSILCPLLVPIRSIDPTVFRVPGQQHWRASFDGHWKNRKIRIKLIR